MAINENATTVTDHSVQGLFVREYAPARGHNRPSPLVMIHGGGHGWWAFEAWGTFFAERGWIGYALSLRNHTDSYAVPENEFVRLSVEDYVHDVLTVLQWIAQPCAIIGHSMGGIIAQKVAETRDLVALVLVGTVGPAQLGAFRKPIPEDKPVMVSRDTARAAWFHGISDEAFDAAYARLVPESPSVMNEYATGRVPVDRASIHCPVFALQGEYDRSGLQPLRAIAGFYACDQYLAPDCGHDVMLEPAGEQAAARIDAWLRANIAREQGH
jgi:pimeloyl-ACP methyl ester carboxylesterase